MIIKIDIAIEPSKYFLGSYEEEVAATSSKI